MRQTTPISVLGAGVAGLCAATALQARGLPVAVIEAPGAPASASLLAGGMLAPFCESDGAPGIVTERGQAAIGWWQSHVDGVVQAGTLVVAAPRDAAELPRMARATTAHAWVDPGELEPGLAGRFTRGLFFAQEAHLEPAKALAQLRARLVARGVAFQAGTQAGRLVDCRGFGARDRLADLRAVRGERLEVLAPDVQLSRPVRLLHPRFPCYVVPRGGGRYMIGATMVESANPGGITARAAVELLSAAYTIHPGFADAELLESGAGLRPAFPDNVPAIRREGGRIHLNGMYRHGFLLAPSLAEELAQMLAAEAAHAH